jgi:hypothetical protein
LYFVQFNDKKVVGVFCAFFSLRRFIPPYCITQSTIYVMSMLELGITLQETIQYIYSEAEKKKAFYERDFL